jgi:CRISPR-associated protein Cmr4
MPRYNTHAYVIKALTNIHPGSGDESYGTVDKVVQRDPADNLPCINSTSLKGALREYFENESGLSGEDVKFIFGEKPNVNNPNRQQAKGNYQFFAANLLSLPVRSTRIPDYKGIPYYNVTSENILNNLLDLCSALNYSNEVLQELKVLKNLEEDQPTIFEGDNPVLLEGIKGKIANDPKPNTTSCKNLIGQHMAITSGIQMKDFGEALPIIARNQLENGESKNLWYEEVLPRETRFYFFLRIPEGENKRFESFEKEILENVIQIGANASVGFGYCTFLKLA